MSGDEGGRLRGQMRVEPLSAMTAVGEKSAAVRRGGDKLKMSCCCKWPGDGGGEEAISAC